MARFEPVDGYPDDGRVQRVVVVAFADGIVVVGRDGTLPTADVEHNARQRDVAFQAALDLGVRGQQYHPFASRPLDDGIELAVWIHGELRDPSKGVVIDPRSAESALRDAGEADLCARAYESIVNQPLEQYWEDNRRWLEEVYLAAPDVYGGSGHGGGAETWRIGRRLHVDAVRSDGTLLDTGCANGLLLESMVEWAAEQGYRLEPYGIDFSERFVDVARRRLPQWADRIQVGNALTWEPPTRFDYVCTRLEYVPERLRPDLTQRLLDEVVAPGGRLIVTSYGCTMNPEWAGLKVDDHLRRMGFTVAAAPESAEPARNRVHRIAVIDAE